MPKRRFGQARVPRVPKAPKMAKPPRPSARDLRVAYKGLISADQTLRLAALGQALQWYDRALPYVMFKKGGKQTADDLAILDKAVKCRARYVQGATNSEKETSARMALRQYQKLCAVCKPPNVDEFFATLQTDEQRLKEKQVRLEMKFAQLKQAFVGMQLTNLDGKPIDLKIAPSEQAYRMDPERSMLTLSRGYARELYRKFRREGMLPFVITILEPVSRMMSMEPERDPAGQPTGKYIVKAAAQKDAITKILNGLVAFAKTPQAPRKLVRLPAAERITTGAGGPPRRAPGAQGAIPRGPKVAGVFVENTAPAVLYEKMKDQQWYGLTDLQSMINAKLESRLKKLHKVGNRLKVAGQPGWSVEIDIANQRARMVT